jgi:hypothetical protein
VGGTAPTRGGEHFLAPPFLRGVWGDLVFFEFGAPSFQLRAPSFEFGAPSFEFGAPSFQLRAPSFQLGTPSVCANAPVVFYKLGYRRGCRCLSLYYARVARFPGDWRDAGGEFVRGLDLFAARSKRAKHWRMKISGGVPKLVPPMLRPYTRSDVGAKHERDCFCNRGKDYNRSCFALPQSASYRQPLKNLPPKGLGCRVLPPAFGCDARKILPPPALSAHKGVFLCR